MWWKHDEGYFEEDLKPFWDDGDASELAMYVVENNCEVEIFCEPKPITIKATFMDRVKDKGKGNACDKDDDKLNESNGDSGDEYVRDVHFDDNEEDSYMIGELDSEGDDERPCLIRFNVEDSLSKDFVFKVGMKFSSLKQFKDVILEHNVLNDMDVRFEKNDGSRCKVVAETLAALLGGDDVLYIQPLSVNKSPIKPTESKPSGVNVFFGKQPKVFKNKPFKAPQLSSPKPTCSEPVSIRTKNRYKNVDVVGAKRQSERPKTLKTKDVSGHSKKPNDPLVITEEYIIKEFVGGGRI
ncbi:hypothetical protein KIW84_033731 [Lathyrus oleraceus]|uniref:Uncharacterized protein n=1 Tax=Pisum sativum TaxID=3888 RepID=A0A9D5B3H3_PEA|nr:hypothetical protein KIW84_033731 [Pisum sativum]